MKQKDPSKTSWLFQIEKKTVLSPWFMQKGLKSQTRRVNVSRAISKTMIVFPLHRQTKVNVTSAPHVCAWFDRESDVCEVQFVGLWTSFFMARLSYAFTTSRADYVRNQRASISNK